MHISDITNDELLPSTFSSLGAIFDSSAESKPLTKGAQGSRVKELQTLLNTFDYKLTVDGIFGRGTEAAVKLVQSKLGMAQTGIYDRVLDTRIRGITQSGVINPSPSEQKDVAAVASSGGAGSGAGSAIVPVTQPTPGAPPKLPAAGTLTVTQDGKVVTAEAGTFMDAIQNFIKAPEFKFYVVGAAVLIIGAVLYFGPKTTKPAPVQVMGLDKPPTKKRKTKKTAKVAK